MNEIIFLVEKLPDSGYIARAVSQSIFTESDNLAQLHERTQDAVLCHFETINKPEFIRLHFVKDGITHER